MARLPTCPYCSQTVNKNEPSKKYKTKTYHLHCYKQYSSELFKQNVEEIEPQKELYDYICKLFKIKEMTPFLINQVQKIFKENKFTYDGVLYSLKYFFETKENPPRPEMGVAIVPYIYEEAKEFYIKKNLLEENIKDKNIDKKEDIVFVRKKERKNKFLIDLESL